MTIVTAEVQPGPLPSEVITPSRSGMWSLIGNWKLGLGLSFILFLVLFSVIGRFLVTWDDTIAASGPLSKMPSVRYPLGTDNVGRSILALMVYGIPTSLEIGLIAALIGTVGGTVLGLTSGFFRGPFDSVVRSLADIALTIPSLMILVVIASYFRTTSIELTAVVVAIFAWAGPTRAIRAQTLSMRERGFVEVARLSGVSGLRIVLLEIMPNLIPYIAAGFVGSVSGGILASVGIQLLGLGPIFVPNLGMILQFAFSGAALYKGMWWWWAPPTIALMMLFIGLFMISLALDEFANPRLRRKI